MLKNKSEIKRILVINFGGIGDQILFLPTLKTIKESYDNAIITFVTEPRSKSIKDLASYIDELIICDLKTGNKYVKALKLLLQIRKGKYDIVFSCGGSQFVSILLFLTGIRNKIGYNSGKLSEFILTKAIKLNKQQYAVDMYYDLVRHLKPNDNILPEIELAEEYENQAREIINSDGKQTILIHPGVSQLSIQKNIIKFWDVKSWSNLIINLSNDGSYKVVLCGGPDDKGIIDNIESQLNQADFKSDNYLNLYGQTKNILQLAGLIKVCDLLVCVDSAPMHIAVGLNKKLVSLFGPTDEKKLLPADNNNFVVVTNNDNSNCRPCLWDKRHDSCEKLNCLDINYVDVLQKITSTLY